MPGLQEILIIVVVVIFLSATGLLPLVMKTFREFRGDTVQDPTSNSGGSSSSDFDIYFRLLGLSPSATWSDIEKAYRGKAKLHHPDHGGDEDAMRTLNEAYQQLKRMRGR